MTSWEFVNMIRIEQAFSDVYINTLRSCPKFVVDYAWSSYLVTFCVSSSSHLLFGICKVCWKKTYKYYYAWRMGWGSVLKGRMYSYPLSRSFTALEIPFFTSSDGISETLCIISLIDLYTELIPWSPPVSCRLLTTSSEKERSRKESSKSGAC